MVVETQRRKRYEFFILISGLQGQESNAIYIHFLWRYLVRKRDWRCFELVVWVGLKWKIRKSANCKAEWQIFTTEIKPYFRTDNFFFIFHGLFRRVAISFFFSSTSSFSLANSSSVIGSSSESESELQTKAGTKTITKTEKGQKFSLKHILGVNSY